MKLHEAVGQSIVSSAYRCWEVTPDTVEELDRKYIVLNNLNEDVYVVWAKDFQFARELFPQEYHKIQDKLDWEPISPKVVNV